VYEDKHVVAFLDVQPAAVGHLLVIPTAHAADLSELTAKQGARLFRVAHRLARALQLSAVPSEGTTLFLADGAAAGQEVFHVHMHLIPRSAGDESRADAVWVRPSRAELDRIALSIRAGLTTLTSTPAEPSPVVGKA
jgi:histidine triad (HIT) family protein